MPDLYAILKPLTIELLRIAWNDSAAATGVVLGAFDVEAVAVQRIFADLKIMVKGVEETTKDEIRELIAQQAAGGFSPADVADALRALGIERSKIRAETIAITATTESYSRGSLLAYRESGVVDRKEWLTADTNACEVCDPLNGKVVALDEEFAPGIRFPGAHPRCRCVILPRLTEGV